MLDFYGLKLVDKTTGKIELAANWEQRQQNLESFPHNNLRISRILQCLQLFGFKNFDFELVTCLTNEITKGRIPSSKVSCKQYWIPLLTNEQADHLLCRIEEAQNPEELITIKEVQTAIPEIQEDTNVGWEIGRQISYLLRHGAEREGVPMNDNGQVKISDLLIWLQNRTNRTYTRRNIENLVQTDRKQRYMIQWHVNDTTLDTIKANNGHSMHLPLMDVKEHSPTHNIIHATYLSKLSSIFRNGLNRGKRMHIHFCEHL